MPKVSVIVPVYGVEKYIERCARSLFEQTLDDIEYLFIDDCTPDKSVEILKKVLEEYPNRKEQVIIHRMEQNSGQAVVRKWGMQNAKGEYAIHCDSDDWIEKDIYQILYHIAKTTDSDIVFCDYFLEYSDGRSIPYHRNVPIKSTKYLIGNMLLGYYDANPLWGALVKSKLMIGINYPLGNQGEDSVIMMQLIYKASKLYYVKRPCYHYFINEYSITRNTSIDKVINRVNQSVSNVDTIQCFLEQKNLASEFTEHLVVYKFKIRCFLWPYMKNKLCRSFWSSVFPEINGKILSNKSLKPTYKLYEILYRLGVSSFFCKYI